MHKLIRQKILASHKTLPQEGQDKILNKFENSRTRGKLFLQVVAEKIDGLKEETGLNVKKMITEANPNVGTAIIYNEGYKAAIREVYSWITTD